MRSGSNDAISVHFIGSIVYIEAGLSQVSHQSPLVIDDQHALEFPCRWRDGCWIEVKDRAHS